MSDEQRNLDIQARINKIRSDLQRENEEKEKPLSLVKTDAQGRVFLDITVPHNDLYIRRTYAFNHPYFSS